MRGCWNVFKIIYMSYLICLYLVFGRLYKHSLNFNDIVEPSDNDGTEIGIFNYNFWQ